MNKLLTAILLLLTSTCCTYAQPGPGPAAISGTVLDTNQTPVIGAKVTLVPLGRFGETSATSADDGNFTFAAVSPGTYHLEIATPGFDPYTSPEFIVHADTPLTLPSVTLKISTSASVNVVANPEQIALAQIHEEESQRILGVFQNFYTSYIWDAQPIPTKQKYTIAIRSLIDPPQFLVVAALAGAEQYEGTYPGYGPGINGYGKRFGATLADSIDARIIGSAILPSLLHQDPRYFYQGSGSVASRTLHAVSFTFTTRGDNGHTQPNYSHLLGSLAAAGISNAYHPPSSRGVGPTFQTFGIGVAGNIAGNILREFLLRHLVSVPAFANGKHATPTR